MQFEPVAEKHFSFIHEWFNLLHVQKFYSLRSWTYEEVVLKMHPYVTGEKKVSAFIVYIDDIAIASVQKYKILDYPWPDMGLSDEIIGHTAGIDFFIGPFSFLRKGFGFKIMNEFLKQKIWPFFEYCIVDPDIKNNASRVFFKKLGFKEHKKIKTKDALEKDVELMLMLMKNNIRNI